MALNLIWPTAATRGFLIELGATQATVNRYAPVTTAHPHATRTDRLQQALKAHTSTPAQPFTG